MSAKVMVGLSGGVDSSVAALLLKDQGVDVEALFMKNWEEDDAPEYCSAAEDLADAEAVCERIGIRLHTVNFSSEYWDRVFEHFLAEYRAGRTPNPDVLCNQEIKFRAFLDHARWLGAAGIATGHYARIRRSADGVQLLRGLDPDKDQSYFLYRLDQGQLAASRFPIGELNKSEVRQRARKAGLPTHSKKDSTGICFIGERRFDEFLGRYLPACPGPIETLDGQPLGQHQGLMYHTIGQRKGLGIGGRVDASEAPWYVVDKRVGDNTLIVAQGHDHPYLHRTRLEAGQLNWIAGSEPSLPLRCSARIRYRQTDQPCRVQRLGADRITVEFDEPLRAITPGQSVVLYSGEICLGGGIIERSS